MVQEFNTSPIKVYHSEAPLHLESGGILPSFKIAYQTFGRLNKDRSNAVWVVHALSGNTDPMAWWPGIVGPGCVIDPEKHYVICANSLGSYYGSTSATDFNPVSGMKYYHDFPLLTNRDIVQGFEQLRRHLLLEEISLLIGASLGGQQALEWSILQPFAIKRLCLIATNAKHSAYGIAFNESQRMAIKADQTWHLSSEDAGKEGLKVARAIALLSYRSYQGYKVMQSDEGDVTDNYRASSYQSYQGNKFVKRFNAFSYWSLSKAMDSHDVGRKRGGLAAALSEVKATTVVISIDSDVLFPPEEQQLLAQCISDAKLHSISSIYGHDGFLVENKKVSAVIEHLLSLQEVITI